MHLVEDKEGSNEGADTPFFYSKTFKSENSIYYWVDFFTGI